MDADEMTEIPFDHAKRGEADRVCFVGEENVATPPGPDKFPRRWNCETGMEILPPLRHDAEVYSAQFSPDGERAVTACADNCAFVWDLKTGAPTLKFSRNRNKIVYAAFSPDGRNIVTASQDNSAWIW